MLVLTWHHFEELIRHKDDIVASQRFSFLQSLPILAWPASLPDRMGLGNVQDILAMEVFTQLRLGATGLENVRSDVLKNIFCFGSGVEALEPYADNWRILRPILQAKAAREREIVAISHSKYEDNYNEKAQDFLFGQVRSPELAKRRFATMNAKLSRDIMDRGDKRIPDPSAVSREFLAGVFNQGSKHVMSPQGFGRSYLAELDIDEDEVTEKMTVFDLGELGIFRAQLKSIVGKIDEKWSVLRARAQPNLLPSYCIQRALNKYRQDPKERKGSELTDRYLAALAPYVDRVFVDKRTKNNFLQAGPKVQELVDLSISVRKEAHYTAILKHIDKY